MLTAKEARKISEESAGELVNKVFREIQRYAEKGRDHALIWQSDFSEDVEKKLIEMGYTIDEEKIGTNVRTVRW